MGIPYSGLGVSVRPKRAQVNTFDTNRMTILHSPCRPLPEPSAGDAPRPAWKIENRMRSNDHPHESTTARRRLRVGIIGSGFGGIALAVKLKARTNADIVIFEQDGGIGGTWWQNRYPGCEVDIPSHVYSFSFVKWDWPRTHATQPEL